MATYHNEKPLSEIALVNCFNKITANGIRTAEQLRQTEYYQEAIEAIYNFVRDAALKTKKSKDMLKASGLEADDVAGSFIIACMEKDGKINGLLNCLLVFNLPFTFFKGMLDAVICFAIYKPLSPILHGRNSGGKSVTA